jgi:hypothetical protein
MLRYEKEAGDAPVIRFEGLPGDCVQWDWGKARLAEVTDPRDSQGSEVTP